LVRTCDTVPSDPNGSEPSAKPHSRPVSVGGGLLAGLIGKKLFSVIWGWIDDQDPPKPEHRNLHIGKLLIALTLEGAPISLIRRIVNHDPGTPTRASPAHGPERSSQRPASKPSTAAL